MRFPSHSHPAGEQLFVVEGRIRIEGTWYDSGCAVMLIRMPAPGKILED